MGTSGGSTRRSGTTRDCPKTAFGARGAGSNTITILPEEDLVVVWRWHRGNEAEFVQRVVAAIKR
jgi:CubicO group peptidase (beta-lactamase class C family)